MRKTTNIVATLVVLLSVGAIVTAAYASEQTANLIPKGAPSGYLAIDAKTCKFIHPEIDVKPTPGERYARAEDSRDDVKLSCLTRKIDSEKAAKPDVDGVTGYVRVSAAINFKQASATVSCPAGDVVLGGGATVEVGGSYPSTDTTWTVTRDHMWGTEKTGAVYATCARAQ